MRRRNEDPRDGNAGTPSVAPLEPQAASESPLGAGPAQELPPDPAPTPDGMLRVKAKKTALVGGMARSAGEVFTMSAQEFEARKDRDEFERL